MESLKVTSTMYLLSVLLLAVSVRGVDVLFFSSTSDCSGSAYAFTGLPPQECALASGGAVLFTGGAGSCQQCVVYKSSGCNGNSAGSGGGPICFVGGGFGGAYYYNTCRRRSLLAEEFTEETKPSALCGSKPSSVVYTEDYTQGKWMLKTGDGDAEQLLEQLNSVSQQEKVSWLQAQGATYQAAEAGFLPKTVQL